MSACGYTRKKRPPRTTSALPSCVDGSLLARDFVTLMQHGRVLPCVRPVDAARMAAGPNAIRRNGSQSASRARGTWGQTGFSGPRFDRLCITSLSLRQTPGRLVSCSYTALADAALRYVPPCRSSTQAIRAFLLASATAATLVGLLAIMWASHGSVVPRRLA